MSARVLRLLLALYPPGWRRRHGDELDQLVADLAHEPGFSGLSVAADLFCSALAQRLRLSATAAVGVAAAAVVVAAVVVPLLVFVVAPGDGVRITRDGSGRVTRFSGAPVSVTLKPSSDKVVSIKRRHRDG